MAFIPLFFIYKDIKSGKNMKMQFITIRLVSVHEKNNNLKLKGTTNNKGKTAQMTLNLVNHR